jgi:hypothetical protein
MNPDRRRLAQLALLFPWLPFLRPRLPAPSRAAAQRTQGNVSEDGAREVWWRTDWARIIELSGSWAVQAEADFTFLIPEDPACVLRILRRSTGEVFEYEMTLDGQVALALGWILISRDGPLDCAARESHLMKERPDIQEVAYPVEQGLKSALTERIVVRGPRPFRFEPPGDDRYHLQAWREIEPGDSQNQLVVQGIVGNVVGWPADDRALQTRVLFMRKETGYSKERLRVIEMVAKK